MKTQNIRLKEILAGRKNQTFAVSGVSLLVIAVLIFFSIVPAFQSITDQLKNNEAKNVYIDQMTQKISNMNTLLAAYEDSKDQITVFDNYFRTKNNDELWTANINKYFEKNGCILAAVNFKTGGQFNAEESVAARQYQDVPALKLNDLDMQGVCNKKNVRQLVADLEGLPLVVSISGISLSQNIAQEGEPFDPEIYGIAIVATYFTYNSGF
jgi:hypothetical protein